MQHTLRFRFFSDAPPALIPENERGSDDIAVSAEERLERAHQAWLDARERLMEMESTRDLSELLGESEDAAKNDAA